MPFMDATQHRAARQGVNPRNPSQKVQIPAAWVPKFSAGSSLKTAIRGALPGDPSVPWDDEDQE
jgi:hypothetical protein